MNNLSMFALGFCTGLSVLSITVLTYRLINQPKLTQHDFDHDGGEYRG